MSFFSIIKNYNKSRKPPTCTAVIAAAGVSQRCKGEDKLFYLINDKPVLAYTLDTFQSCRFIREIIIVTREERFEEIASICRKFEHNKVSQIIGGGSTRVESVINGVYAASNKTNLIAIHDGGRPFLDIVILEKTIKAAAKYHAAAPAIAITSTIKRVNDGVISGTVNRESLYEVQTPQIFRAEVIKAALTNAVKKSINITDDCMAAEIIGVPVHIVEGSRRNIKVTNIEDLYIAETYINENEEYQNSN